MFFFTDSVMQKWLHKIFLDQICTKNKIECLKLFTALYVSVTSASILRYHIFLRSHNPSALIRLHSRAEQYSGSCWQLECRMEVWILTREWTSFLRVLWCSYLMKGWSWGSLWLSLSGAKRMCSCYCHCRHMLNDGLTHLQFLNGLFWTYTAWGVVLDPHSLVSNGLALAGCSCGSSDRELSPRLWLQLQDF